MSFEGEQSQFERLNQEYVNRGAFNWPSRVDLWSGANVRYRLTAEAIRQDYNSSSIIMNFGGGDGALTYFLDKQDLHGSTVINLDLNRFALKLAQQKNVEFGYETDLVQSDILLPITSDSVDYITALEVMEHVEDDDGLFGDLTRVLKPGGQLILSTPSDNFPLLDTHYRHYSIKELIEKAELMNLTVEKIFGQMRIQKSDTLIKKSVIAVKRTVETLTGNNSLSGRCIHDDKQGRLNMEEIMRNRFDGYLLCLRKPIVNKI